MMSRFSKTLARSQHLSDSTYCVILSIISAKTFSTLVPRLTLFKGTVMQIFYLLKK